MTKKSVVHYFFGFSFLFLIIVAGITFAQDPYCDNCEEIDLNRYSVNSYYQTAQILKANPDAEIIIVGTSRGQGFSPKWMSQFLGKKVLNIAVAGSGAEAKIAFIELAKKLTAVKFVIWQADYFEILGDNQDANLHAMKLYNLESKKDLSYYKGKIALAIDHSHFEAAVASLTRSASEKLSLDLGAGSDLPESCFDDTYVGPHSVVSLKKEVDLLYYNYTTRVFRPSESQWKKDRMLSYFKNDIGLDFLIVFMPYHPDFTKLLGQQHPQVARGHANWISELQLATGRVQDFSMGIKEDDGSPKYWTDGTHLTCYGSHQILKKILLNEKSLGF